MSPWASKTAGKKSSWAWISNPVTPYTLSKDIVKRYVKVVNYLRITTRIEDLFLVKSLHYEKKKGNMKDIEAIWISKKYRLLFKSSQDESGIAVNILLLEISKHYE